MIPRLHILSPRIIYLSLRVWDKEFVLFISFTELACFPTPPPSGDQQFVSYIYEPVLVLFVCFRSFVEVLSYCWNQKGISVLWKSTAG